MTVGLQDEKIRREVQEALQEGKPYATYKKTVLGRIVVRLLDPIRLIAIEEVLSGDPEDNPDTAIVSVWSPSEDKYLKRNNKLHLESGMLIPCESSELEIATLNQVSDEEIEEILSKPFLALKNKLETFTSTVPVRRFLLMAEKMNRPIKTVDHIKQVLSEMETDPVVEEKLHKIELEI